MKLLDGFLGKIYLISYILIGFILVMGVVVLDSVIHQEARITAGIVMAVLVIFSAFYHMIALPVSEEERAKEKRKQEEHEIKIERQSFFKTPEGKLFRKALQDSCKHNYQYETLSCRCDICGKHNGK